MLRLLSKLIALLFTVLFVIACIENDEHTSSCELGEIPLSDLSGPWTRLSNIPSALRNHSVSACSTKLFVTGGLSSNNEFSASLDVYDLVTGTWESKQSMSSPRRGHTSHVIGETLYVIGGETNKGEMSLVEAFLLDSNEWVDKKSLGSERSFHSSCVVDEKIYVFGGFTEDGTPYTHNKSLASVEVYDPQTDSWSERSPMFQKNWGMSCAVFNNRIYVSGGAHNEFGYDIYNPVSDSWEVGGSLPSEKRYGFATTIIDGVFYLFGGWVYRDEVEAINLNDASVLIKSPIPIRMQSMGYVRYKNAIVLVGGATKGRHLKSVFVYSPELE